MHPNSSVDSYHNNLLEQFAPSPLKKSKHGVPFQTGVSLQRCSSEALRGSTGDSLHRDYYYYYSHSLKVQISLEILILTRVCVLFILLSPFQDPAGSEELSRTAGRTSSVPAPLLGGLLTLVGSLVLVSLILLFAVRRRKQCCGRPIRGAGGASGSLNKCMQQYVTNPTYYSSAPETPLRKVLHDVEINVDDISFVEEIGEGCFGKVHKAVYTLPNGEKENVAVKILKDTVSSEAQADFEREVQIMSSFKHENILKLLGVVFKGENVGQWPNLTIRPSHHKNCVINFQENI